MGQGLSVELVSSVMRYLDFLLSFPLQFLMLTIVWKKLFNSTFFFSGSWDARTDGSSTGCIL